ncbi:hypothetical protein RI367_002641 [Sorochytrium milnesiophthora]
MAHILATPSSPTRAHKTPSPQLLAAPSPSATDKSRQRKSSFKSRLFPFKGGDKAGDGGPDAAFAVETGGNYTTASSHASPPTVSHVTVPTGPSASQTSPSARKRKIGAPFGFEQKLHVDNQLNWLSGVDPSAASAATGATASAVAKQQDPSEIFALGEKLGEGAFGAVYKATLKQTGFVLAIKEIKIQSSTISAPVRRRRRVAAAQPGEQEAQAAPAPAPAPPAEPDLPKEIEFLKKCVHRNTVQYFGCCRLRNDKLWILMDYCACGSISDIISMMSMLDAPDFQTAHTLSSGNADPGDGQLRKVKSSFMTSLPGMYPKTVKLFSSGSANTLLSEPPALSSTGSIGTQSTKTCTSGLAEQEVAAITGGAVEGLAFLHTKGIIHRDLKCANILLTEQGEVKIADFGVSEQITSSMANHNTVVGTPYWMAPEVILGNQYGIEADIWSMGITLIELVDGLPPHHEENPMRILFQIPHLPPPTVTEPAAHSAILSEFVALCLKKNTTERHTAAALQQHPFIAEFTGAGGVIARRRVLLPKIKCWLELLALQKVQQQLAQTEFGDATQGLPQGDGGDDDLNKAQQSVIVHGDTVAATQDVSGTVVIHSDDTQQVFSGTVIVKSDQDEKDDVAMFKPVSADKESSKPHTVETVIVNPVVVTPKVLRSLSVKKQPKAPAPPVIVAAPQTADDDSSTTPGAFVASPVSDAPPGSELSGPPSWITHLSQYLHRAAASPAVSAVARYWTESIQPTVVSLKEQVVGHAYVQQALQQAPRGLPGWNIHLFYISIILSMRWYYQQPLLPAAATTAAS